MCSVCGHFTDEILGGYNAVSLSTGAPITMDIEAAVFPVRCELKIIGYGRE